MGLELQENAAHILRGQGGGSDGSHHAGQQLTPYPSTGFRSESGPKHREPRWTVTGSPSGQQGSTARKTSWKVERR